jgi:3-oxoacyl-[acyl-carrier-protein] synthase III
VVVEALEPIFKANPGWLFRSSSYGNTVGSSIPIQLEQTPITSNLLGLVGFGMGLSALSTLLKVSER